MSLLSKLFGDGNSGDSALNALKKAAEAAVTDATAKLNEAAERMNADAQNRTAGQQPAREPVQSRPVYQPATEAQSFWDAPPAEENQYNFPGTYIQYFDKIFREEFPSYTVVMSDGTDSRSPVFTFTAGGRPALLVELKSENSEAQKIRSNCRAAGIPYLRFYYDHEGWWNTRAYVTDRVRRALGG